MTSTLSARILMTVFLLLSAPFLWLWSIVTGTVAMALLVGLALLDVWSDVH